MNENTNFLIFSLLSIKPGNNVPIKDIKSGPNYYPKRRKYFIYILLIIFSLTAFGQSYVYENNPNVI